MKGMKFYYTGYSCIGWMPAHDGQRAGWYQFDTVDEYAEAYKDAVKGELVC